MKEDEVKAYLDKWNLKWEDFDKWIVGQTVGLDTDGKPLYYDWDVKRFVQEHFLGESNELHD